MYNVFYHAKLKSQIIKHRNHHHCVTKFTMAHLCNTNSMEMLQKSFCFSVVVPSWHLLKHIFFLRKSCFLQLIFRDSPLFHGHPFSAVWCSRFSQGEVSFCNRFFCRHCRKTFPTGGYASNFRFNILPLQISFSFSFILLQPSTMEFIVSLV